MKQGLYFMVASGQFKPLVLEFSAETVPVTSQCVNPTIYLFHFNLLFYRKYISFVNYVHRPAYLLTIMHPITYITCLDKSRVYDCHWIADDQGIAEAGEANTVAT